MEHEMEIEGWKMAIADARECVRLAHETDDIEILSGLLSRAIVNLEIAKRMVLSLKNRKTEGEVK